MFVPALILHADPALLRLASAIAFAFSIMAFLTGLKRPRVRPDPTPLVLEPILPNLHSGSAPHPASPEPETAGPQLIRLSLPSIPARSTEMTQQEKVAAAMARAGIANPVGWTSPSPTPSEDESVSTSTAVANTSSFPEKAASPMTRSNQPATTDWGRNILLFGGPLVALISLYLFLRIR